MLATVYCTMRVRIISIIVFIVATTTIRIAEHRNININVAYIVG